MKMILMAAVAAIAVAVSSGAYAGSNSAINAHPAYLNGQ